MLCWTVLWECLRNDFWPSFPRSLVKANQISYSVFQNSPTVQCDTTPTQSIEQPKNCQLCHFHCQYSHKPKPSANESTKNRCYCITKFSSVRYVLIQNLFYRWFTFFAISLSSSMSAISLPDAPPILVPITMLPTIVAAGPGSRKKNQAVLIVNLSNRSGEERRRQSLCDKRDNNFVWNSFSPNFTSLWTDISVTLVTHKRHAQAFCRPLPSSCCPVA